MEFIFFMPALGTMLGGVLFAIREEANTADAGEEGERIVPKATYPRMESSSRFRVGRCGRKSRFRTKPARI
jgi:hypothetical protein